MVLSHEPDFLLGAMLVRHSEASPPRNCAVQAGKRFRIERDRCTGCCDCMRVCQDNAICRFASELCAKCVKYCGVMKGEELRCSENKMCIDEDACTGCGKCIEACRFDAILAVC